MKVDYGEIVKRAFEVTKNNRALWVFGFILALFGGGSLNFQFPNFNFDNSSFRESGRGFNDFPLRSITSIDPTTIILIIVAVAILLIVIWLIAKFLQALANGALIDMVDKVDRKKPISIKSGFSEGFSLGLPLIGINLIIWIPFILVAVMIAGLAIGPGLLILLAKYEVAGIILMVLGALLWLAVLILAAIAVGVINLYANRYYVLEEQALIQSIRSGYSLLRTNLGPSTLLWLINVAIGLASGIVGIIVVLVIGGLLALVLGLPIALLALAVSKWLFILLAVPILLFIFVISFYGGLFQSYFSSYWTLAFKQMTLSSKPAS